MKKGILAAICCLFALGMLAGCAATETITRVITENKAATLSATITRTVVQLVGTETQTSVVALAANPPLIPHGPTTNSMGEFGGCFECHPIPPGHTGRLMFENVCGECHLQGPVSYNIGP